MNRSKIIGMLLAIALLAPVASRAQSRGRPAAASNRQAARPQTSTSRVSSQANPRATSPSPSQARAAERDRPDRRRGERAGEQRSGRAAQALDQSASRGEGQRRPSDPRLRGSESPRQAMERGLRHRLSQIDRMRDYAIDAGDLDLLDLADQLELDARRKFATMIERIDSRQQAGLPGVGPSVESPRRNSATRNERRIARVPSVLEQNQEPAIEPEVTLPETDSEQP